MILSAALPSRTTVAAFVALGVAALMPPSSCEAAPRMLGPATDAGQPNEPFGLDTLPLPDGALRKKWAALIHELGRENDRLTLCEADRPGCVLPSARAFLAIVDATRARQGRARIGEVNRSINLAIRPMSDLDQHGEVDFWSLPLPTFQSGADDCEDYAIAKYAALRQAGAPAGDLRIVIVRESVSEKDHAIAAVRFEGHWLFLDNRRMTIAEDGYLTGYRPLFVFNEYGIWKYRDVPAGLAQRRRGWDMSLNSRADGPQCEGRAAGCRSPLLSAKSATGSTSDNRAATFRHADENAAHNDSDPRIRLPGRFPKETARCLKAAPWSAPPACGSGNHGA